jgi:hypothetical protein
LDQFKRDNFRKFNPLVPFPETTVLVADECDSVREQLALRLGGSPGQSGAEVTQRIAEEADFVRGVDAKKDDFKIEALLHRLGLDHSEYALLNWGNLDELDRVRVRDLGDYFSDIWYPDSDDLDIIDPQFRWVLSVRHDGVVSVIRFSQ